MDKIKFFFRTIHKNSIYIFILLNLMIIPVLAKASTGVVITNLNLRAEPTKGKRSIMILPKGAVVDILEKGEYWVQISYNGTVGYVSTKFLDTNENASDIKKSGNSNSTKQQKNVVNPNAPQVQQQRQQMKEKIDETRKKINKLEAEKKEIQDRMAEHKANVENCDEKEKDIIIQLDHVDRELNKTNRKLQALRSEIISIDNQIKKTSLAGKDLTGKAKEREVYVTQRIVALYKLKNGGLYQLLCSAESFHDLLTRTKRMEYILKEDEIALKDLATKNSQLENLFQELQQRREEKALLENEIGETTKTMISQKEEHAQILSTIRGKKSLEITALNALDESSRNLDQTILSLKDISKEETQQISPAFDTFSAYKGKLQMPVNGTIITKFGPYTNPKLGVTNFRSGVDIKAKKGEPIKAVCSGKIMFADWFKGYGNMVIIDHGNNYYTVYAHAEELFKTKGDVVQNGEVLGTLGSTGSLEGPSLYFEVRHHGKPINPLKWLSKS